MANEMDELLAQLQAEYEPKRAKSQSAPPPKSQSPTTDADESAMFDELLSDVKTEVESAQPRPVRQPSKDRPSDTDRDNRTNSVPSSTHASNHSQFIEELKQQQRARERAARQQQAEKQREADIAAKKRAEHRELRRRAALTEKARQWLQNLDLNSEEGRWFEEFSYSYDSQLDAAIDYLQAMRESGL